MEYKFPESFFWGSATSSYQVEGGIENCDWASRCRDCQRVKQNSKARPCVPCAGRAADHYNIYEKDFDIAKSLGQNTHRFSIEWARIEPEEGKFDEKEIEHYGKVLDALRDRGMEPFVTLWHFTLPLWFAEIGGFENKKAPFYFSRYCEYVVTRLGDRAKFWITMNEPLVYATAGYLKGEWPPFNKNLYSFWKVIKTLISSHLASHNMIFCNVLKTSQNTTTLCNVNSTSHNVVKEKNFHLKIGVANHIIDFDSPWWNPVDLVAKAFLNFFWNHYFLKKISKHQDFIGINYYFHKHFGYKFYEEKSDIGWPIYPKGIYHVLMDLKRYKKPIYVTENGLADAKDEKREKFIKNHLRWVWQAIHDGVDVRGYFYWSLLDNFEWKKGFDPRFGLIEVNYDTMERKIRPSAYEYAKICKTNTLEIR